MTPRNDPQNAPADDLLTLEELAHACCMQPGWVVQRLEAGVLHGERDGTHWRIASASVVRARRIARLETTFDADPELAALTADLIEEVTQLRRRLGGA